jgi:hypothetical protein
MSVQPVKLRVLGARTAVKAAIERLSTVLSVDRQSGPVANRSRDRDVLVNLEVSIPPVDIGKPGDFVTSGPALDLRRVRAIVTDEAVLRRLAPEAVCDYLSLRGWTRLDGIDAGLGLERVACWGRRQGRRWQSVAVPRRREFADYSLRMGEVLAELAIDEGGLSWESWRICAAGPWRWRRKGVLDRIDLQGWLVAEVEVRPSRFDRPDGGRLYLFRGPVPEATWSLLHVHHSIQWDGNTGMPLDGAAHVWLETYPSLPELRAGMGHGYGPDEWRELVRAGADRDPDLRRLWLPVQIDLDLERSSVHRRDYAVHGTARGRRGWRAEALLMALERLEELGFVILTETTDASELFPRRLVERWSNAVVGAALAAINGHAVGLIVAVDGAGEIYARTADSKLDPGADRRHPPRPLTAAEARHVEDVIRDRRAAVRGQIGERD